VSDPARKTAVSFGAAFRVWLKVGLLSFGGPAGQIALMHRIVVDEKRWLGEARFLHALNYCMLLPGPEAQQLAIYVGWLLHRTWGGIVAGVLFVLPGAMVMMALSLLYAGYREVPAIEALFYGIKAAVLAVVIEAVLRIGRRALKTRFAVMLAAAAFIGIFLLALPFPLIVLGAGVIGGITGLLRPGLLFPPSSLPDDEGLAPVRQPNLLRHSLVTLIVWGGLWLAPVAALLLLYGPGNVYTDVAVFFSQMAVLTFGGAYAVLAYVAQQAVETHGWLTAGEMLDGLGLAETTPGPLILVLQFVGFLAGHRGASGVEPWLGGVLAALLTLWVTFAPSFLWIFLGAPYIERLRGNRLLAGALAAITAAVVGVILNLALWFALHVLFATVDERQLGILRLWVPDWASLDPWALGLAVASLLAMLRFGLGMVPTLAAAAAIGMAIRLLA
jgi:chromate transporter